MIQRHAVIAVAALAVALTAPAYSRQGGDAMTLIDITGQNEPPLACNPGSFTAEERARWQELGKRFLRSAKAPRELPNGYAFEVDCTPHALRDLAQFVELESRCCPFVDFVVRVPAGDRPFTLEMTGRKGVKELIADELGL